MKKIGILPLILLGISTLVLLILFVMKVIENNQQQAIINQTQTAVVATNAAIQTLAAIPTETPTPTATPTLTPTLTPTATETLTPTPTEELPTVEVCTYQATFLEDVTIPDGTELEPDTSFTKTWKLQNAGSCTWNPNYKLIFDSGDQMSGPDSQQLINLDVPPGASIDVSVDLVSPSTAGTYRGDWALRNAAGVRFGIGPGAGSFYLEIKVVDGGE
jgi:type II secretory pathway pseudopilin PulG